MANENQSTFKVGGIAVLGLLGYFGIVKPILEKFGVLDDDATKKAKQLAATQGTPFDPKFYQQQHKDITIMNYASAATLADKLYKAFGYFGDDDNAVVGVFRLLKTKAQVSYLCAVFQQIYNGDLYDWLQNGAGTFGWNGLSEGSLATVISLVDALPNT